MIDHRRGFLTLIWFISLFAQSGLAQAPSVVPQDNYCFDLENPTPISNFMNIAGAEDGTMEGIQVAISQNYDATTDTLTYEDANGITGSWDDANGILTLSGTNTLLIYKQTLEQVFFSTRAPAASAGKAITLALSNLDYLAETGHFYQYVPATSILWNPAREAAATQTLFGLQGYLATITTKAESDFLIERVAGSAWIGATDEDDEGVWRWVTGPEGLENGGQGRVISGFINWNDNEPNNCCGGEHYAHMMDWTSPPGRWNDLNNDSAPLGSPYHPTGYMIEYGGMPGDPTDVFSEITGTTVLDPLQNITLTGPQSLCPNITGAIYTTQELPGYTYTWTVDGGTIVAGDGTHEITVNWGDTNANARVSVKATSGIVCEVESELPVIINVQLEPPLPTGPDVICYADHTTEQSYSTPISPGSDYEWKITNGQIMTGQGTNEITVLWDSPGTGTLYFTESTTTATDICDGDSPLLTVDLREQIIPTFDITNVSCFSGTDGAVVITATTGAAPISYNFNTLGQGQVESNGVSNLPAGAYSVDITSAGCTITVPFDITEPTELTGTVSAMDALCFGTATGQAEALVTGGTGNYRYFWSVSRPGNQSAITGLAKGEYSVDVVDENDCVLTLNFFIDEPELLVLDSIASTLVTCPQGDDGTLEAFVSGGTEPYSYTWEFSEDTEALATGFPKGTYMLTVTDANGCVVNGSQMVEEATPKLYMPNAFSPNNDGDNDRFGPKLTCSFSFQMTIYNRWGNVVFVTSPSAASWDGTVDGQEAPVGRYSYTAAWSITVNDRLISEERMGTLRLYR